MFWIVTCFVYPRVFTKEGSCGDCCLSCGPTKYFGPRTPQSFNPALSIARRWLQLRLDFDSTGIRPRYDHSTTNVTTVGLPVVGCNTAV